MNRRVFIFWSICIAAAFFRVLFSFQNPTPDIGSCVKNIVTGFGTISREPERKESGQVMIVLVKNLFLASTTSKLPEYSCSENVYIKIKTALYPRFYYGNEIEFTGKISQPFNFKSDNGRSFNYQGFLAKDDIFYEIKSGFVSSTTVIKNKKSSINSFLFSTKRKFVGNLEHVLGEPHSALAAGLVVGEKSALGKKLLEDFRIVGLIHIVVLSGFNITIVGDVLRRMLVFLPRVWGISVGGIGIMLFGVMVGGGATVIRSCFMAGIALSADLIRRDYQVLRALTFAGLIMLIQNPSILLHDPSFQLSFLATLGLILLASPIEKRIQFISERFGIRGIVASTVATQIFVSPFILYMMGSMSIIGMVVNILVLPIIPLTMLVVFLTGAFGFIWSPLSQFFGWISHLLLSYELLVVAWFAQVPYASVTIPVFSKWWVVGFYVIFAVIYVWLIQRKIKAPTQ
ncbi:MAG: ComEC family competence protein [bacterium]|nr:ComEC family competence protein [bacterium]